MKMRLRHIILLLALALPINFSAQTASFEQDSLLFLDIMKEGFSAVQMDSIDAMKVLQRAQEFADEKDHSFFQLKTQRLHIFYLENWGYVETADSLYVKMIKDAVRLKDEQNLYSAYAGRAALFYKLGKQGQALEFYFKAVAIAERRRDSLNLSKIYNNLSLVQSKLNDYDGSAQTLRKAIAIKRALKDSLGLADNYINLGNIHAKLLVEDSALSYYRLASMLYRGIGDTVAAQLVCNNIGELLYKLNRFDEAAIYIDSSLTIREQMKPNLEYLINLSYRGDIYNRQGQYKQALESFNKIEEILGDQSYPPVLKEVYRGKAEAHAQLAETAPAYEYMLKLSQLEKELNEANEIELQEKYEALFLTNEKENALKLNRLELDNQKGQTRLWTIIGIAAFLLFVLTGILVILNRRRNQVLAEKNSFVTKSLNERETLLREIHHRVKNNLQIVSSMLSIQSRRVKDEDARAGMLDSQNRVNSMSLIHEHLYQDEQFSHVDMPDYVGKLLANLRQSFSNSALEIQMDVANLKLDIDTAVPLGLIINEAITNAVKHAFPESQKGQVKVSLHQVKDQIMLEIADNGAGFVIDEVEKGSFGLTMMRAFTESLEGELTIESHQGTRLKFQFTPQSAA